MKSCLREGAIQEFWSKVGELSWQCEWPLNFVSGEVMKSIYILWEQIQFTTLSTENRSIIWKTVHLEIQVLI